MHRYLRPPRSVLRVCSKVTPATSSVIPTSSLYFLFRGAFAGCDDTAFLGEVEGVAESRLRRRRRGVEAAAALRPAAAVAAAAAAAAWHVFSRLTDSPATGQEAHGWGHALVGNGDESLAPSRAAAMPTERPPRSRGRSSPSVPQVPSPRSLRPFAHHLLAAAALKTQGAARGSTTTKRVRRTPSVSQGGRTPRGQVPTRSRAWLMALFFGLLPLGRLRLRLLCYLLDDFLGDGRVAQICRGTSS